MNSLPSTNRETKILAVATAIDARHCNGRTYAYRVGARVGVTSYVAGPEGGYLQTY